MDGNQPAIVISPVEPLIGSGPEKIHIPQMLPKDKGKPEDEDQGQGQGQGQGKGGE